MKLVSWNVNGISACVTKGFLDYLGIRILWWKKSLQFTLLQFFN
jgi:exonuclease III